MEFQIERENTRVTHLTNRNMLNRGSVLNRKSNVGRISTFKAFNDAIAGKLIKKNEVKTSRDSADVRDENQDLQSFANEKGKLGQAEDMNYERKFFEKNIDETSLQKSIREDDEKVFTFGNDFYTYALFAWYIFDENERKIVNAGPLKKEQLDNA